MDKPFWEETYRDDSVSTFGIKPNASIPEYEYLFKKSWNILEIGCGEGKNPLYLSDRGFLNIDAFDLSENAIAKFSRIAYKQKLKINHWVQDLRHFQFKKQYDLIISFGTLHFVEKPDWKSLLLKAKENTNIDGVHIIQIFTNVLPASPDIAPFATGLADDGEIKSLYSDWNILQFNSYTFEDEHPGVPKHFHAANEIVAQHVINA
jgi:SAM-dependent methyltransferase